MTRAVKLEEIDQSIQVKNDQTRLYLKTWSILTNEAANEPFSQQWHWSIDLTADSGTSSWLDMYQRPPITSFDNKLETKDMILSQEHVLGEDIHVAYTLGPRQ